MRPIDRLSSARTRIAAGILAALLLAIYLFAGFYFSVHAAVAIIPAACARSPSTTPGMRGGLEAVARCDLTVTVEPVTEPVGRVGRDELDEIAQAVDAVRADTLASVGAYEDTRAALTQVMSKLTSEAGTIAQASGVVAATTVQAGQAAGEIADAMAASRPAPRRRRAPAA